AEPLGHGEAGLRRSRQYAAIPGDECAVGADHAVMQRAAQMLADDRAVPQMAAAVGAMRRERRDAAAVAAAEQDDPDAAQRPGQDGTAGELVRWRHEVPVLRTGRAHHARRAFARFLPLARHGHAPLADGRRDQRPSRNPTTSATIPVITPTHLMLRSIPDSSGLSKMLAEKCMPATAHLSFARRKVALQRSGT